jgi:hypothetical protein
MTLNPDRTQKRVMYGWSTIRSEPENPLQSTELLTKLLA